MTEARLRAQQRPPRRSRLELSALLVVERQRAGQECERFALRRAAIATFERADSVRAHPSAFGEGLLREPRGEPVAPQERSQIRRAGIGPRFPRAR